MKFTQMELPDYIVQSLTKQNITEATEIQQMTIPLIMSGADVMGLSQTGSGKTYAYGIPIIETIDKNLNVTQVLIVCPTRELSIQVVDSLKKLLTHEGQISIAAVFGGSNMDKQKKALKNGAKIVVGTPGRLIDHLRRKTLKLGNLKTVVLDEADEMLNIGFKEDIETILKSANKERQTIMFSATMPSLIQKLTAAYMRDPVTIKTQNQESSHELIKQYYVNCKKHQKIETLEKIYDKIKPFVSIIFCNTKQMTEDLTDSLSEKGLEADFLHGDMRQRERERTMKKFKRNGGILIATDVAARGIDVKNVDIIVNFDFPNNEEYYTHRIGRTGRAGSTGKAFTIINNHGNSKSLHALVNKLGGQIEEFSELSTEKFATGETSKDKEKDKRGFHKSKRKGKKERERDRRRDSGQKSRADKPKSDKFGKNSKSPSPKENTFYKKNSGPKNFKKKK